MESNPLFDLIQQKVKEDRRQRFEDSPQLSLGSLIQEIEELGVYDEDGNAKSVRFDFGTMVPTTLASSRSSYDELALGYAPTGYDTFGSDDVGEVNAEDLLEELKGAIGDEFVGWKGGTFKMDENTPVWADNQGNASCTAIVGVVEDDIEQMVILTSFVPF